MARNSRGARTPQQPPPPPTTELRYVDCGDARIAYRIAGRGEVVVFVLQPFWTAMEEVIADPRGFVAHLASRHRVLVHDRRGAGASERQPARLSREAQVDDICAVLTDAGVDVAVLLGMGEAASLAVQAAAERPERVERVVLVDPTLRPLRGPGSAMLLHTLRSKPRAGLRALARTLVNDDEAAAELGARMARTIDGPTAARLYESFLHADTMDMLEDVTAPALLAYGVLDKLISEDEARTIQGKMPNARVGLVQGPAGSDAALREAWIQIRDFLAEIPPRPHVERPRLTPLPDPDLPPRSGRGRGRVPAPPPVVPVDYVPAGPAPRRAPEPVAPAVQPALLTSSANGKVVMTWGPPPDIPPEAIALNRKGIDQILLGEIEQALESFQKALEIAPQYEDAAINHRELLTRLVQRRVAEWQARQAEEALADAERRAEQWAKRAGKTRRPLGWLFRRSA
jgi:pimeloyl-ACP methyl ester carboxylesterase